MVLEVQFEDFAEEIERRFGVREAYIAATSFGSQVTSGDAKSNMVVFARTRLKQPTATKKLEEAKVTVRRGAWTAEDDMAQEAFLIDTFVAAVAYRSREEMPGLWIDAFPSEPTMHDVLTAMLEEFQESGDVGEVDLDDFTNAVDPNVLILSPTDLRNFAERKAHVK